MLARLRNRLRDESGVAMVLAIFAIALLGTISLVLLDAVTNETKRSSQAEERQSAFEAAESGISEYTAKLTDDQIYYLHDVDSAESTRVDTATRASVSATGDCVNQTPRPSPTTWTYGTRWSYPSGKNRWCGLGNGYEYNLQIGPPTASQPGVTIVATGRRVDSTTNQRVIEAVVNRNSITDFQRIADRVDIHYGDDATTTGKVYSNQNIWHEGKAYGDLYAAGKLTVDSDTISGTAKGYDGPGGPYPSLDNVPLLKGHYPINFSGFLASFDNISRAASNAGISLDDASKDAWWLTFNANGTVTIRSCKQSTGSVEDSLPTCTPANPSVRPVPNNGAIHVQQTAIVSGTVDGRVTVASENDIVIGGNLDYEQPGAGDDVLGLEARDSLWVAQYVPNTLNWRAATLTQYGTWQSATSTETHSGKMTFTGSSTVASGQPQHSMFATREYDYDSTLLYLPPPWFPTLEQSWDYVSFRELPAT